MEESVSSSPKTTLLLTSLPREILTEIFSNCSYRTLKFSVAPTCTTFRRILQDLGSTLAKGKLAQKLFIDVFTQRITITNTEDDLPERVFSIHPCFRYLRASAWDLSMEAWGVPTEPWKIENIGFVTASSGFVPLLDTPMATENATSPGYDFTFFTARNAPGKGPEHYGFLEADYAETESGTALTVAELVEALVEKMPTHWQSVLRNASSEEQELYRQKHIFGRVHLTSNFIEGDEPMSLVPDLHFWPSEGLGREPARLTRGDFPPLE